MTVAAVYDIHGNLPALEAVLAEIRSENIDQIIVGGDVVPGPMPRETLMCLLQVATPIHFIYGNGEVAVLAEMEGKDPAVPEQIREAIRWTARQLTSDDRRVLASWPKTVRLEINGVGEVLFCHATPQNENDIFTRLTPDDRLLPIFENCNADVVVCGHTHMKFDRKIGKVRVINAGSVGMPFGRPGANWLLLGPDVRFQHTVYNLQSAAERIRRTNYPQAQEFAERNVLRSPSEEQMLKAFAGTELKPLASTPDRRTG